MEVMPNGVSYKNIVKKSSLNPQLSSYVRGDIKFKFEFKF